MKKVLVTTDLSDESTTAFALAAECAKAFAAEIILLSVLEDPTQSAMIYSMDFPLLPDLDIQKQFREKVEDELKKMAEKYFADSNASCCVHESSGPIHSEIIEFANDNQADLIVMATHGRSGLSRLLVGSITQRVLQESNLPVLSVPLKAKP